MHALMLLSLVLGIVYPRVAHALQPGSVTFDSSPILDASSAGFMPYGPGSSSMLYDDVNSKYVMVMEYQASWTSPICPHGVWGVALSTTTDPEGDSGWSPPIQVFEPSVDGSYKSCVAAHPEAFWLSANRRNLGIVFKAEGDTASCTVGANRNTCVYTGIGSIQVTFNRAGVVTGINPSASPLVNVAAQFPDSEFGFQSPLLFANVGEYYMLVQVAGDLYFTTATNPTGPWSPLTYLMSPADNNFPWALDELFGQELICGAPGEIISFQGGRTWQPGSTNILEAGWSLMRSTNNGRSWTLDPTPIVTWNNDFDWRHWSIVTLGPDEYFFFVTMKDPATNNLEIWRATNFSGAPSGPPTTNRICR